MFLPKLLYFLLYVFYILDCLAKLWQFYVVFLDVLKLVYLFLEFNVDSFLDLIANFFDPSKVLDRILINITIFEIIQLFICLLELVLKLLVACLVLI